MIVPGSANSLLLAQGAATGYNLTKSLRFRSSASAYLNRTPASSGNRTTWTMSIWFKRGTLSTEQHIFEGASSPASANQFYFNTDNTLVYNDNATNYFTTSQVFRDPSAWYHMMVVWNTGNSTASDRIRLYINGSRVTSFSSSTNPSLNATSTFNDNVRNVIGQLNNLGGYYFDGYMTEVNFIDGQQLTPSSFGENNATTGVWQPKKYTGTYGTNGFYLPFTDTTSTTTLGYDSSGNGNNWTTNNFSLTAGSTYDSMTDVPTLTSATTANYCVLNPITAYSASIGTVQYANLGWSQTGTAAYGKVVGTMAMSGSGKYYWEATMVSANLSEVGILSASDQSVYYPGYSPNGYVYYTNGQKGNNNSYVSYGASFTAGDVLGIAFDAGAGTLTFYKNGTSQGTAYTGLTGTFLPAFGNDSSNSANITNLTVNFGQQPFAYTPPTGYVALNTYNLPVGTITTSGTFTGNGSNDGPFIYLNGVPTSMTINGNSVTFATNADKLANGFKVRTSSSSYNTVGSNTYSISTTGANFKYANAQGNP